MELLQDMRRRAEEACRNATEGCQSITCTHPAALEALGSTVQAASSSALAGASRRTMEACESLARAHPGPFEALRKATEACENVAVASPPGMDLEALNAERAAEARSTIARLEQELAEARAALEAIPQKAEAALPAEKPATAAPVSGVSTAAPEDDEPELAVHLEMPITSSPGASPRQLEKSGGPLQQRVQQLRLEAEAPAPQGDLRTTSKDMSTLHTTHSTLPSPRGDDAQAAEAEAKEAHDKILDRLDGA